MVTRAKIEKYSLKNTIKKYDNIKVIILGEKNEQNICEIYECRDHLEPSELKDKKGTIVAITGPRLVPQLTTVDKILNYIYNANIISKSEAKSVLEVEKTSGKIAALDYLDGRILKIRDETPTGMSLEWNSKFKPFLNQIHKYYS